jgi:predicted thioesterase
MPRDSLLKAWIENADKRLAARLHLQPHVHAQVRESFLSELQHLAALAAGERVYIGARITLVRRKRDSKRRERIAAALTAGEAVADIARREQVSEAYVRAVRQRLAAASASCAT